MTVEVAASKQDANVVQLQVRIGAQVIGALAGGSLGSGKTGKYSVKITVPADAKASLTLGIWGQGVLIGSATVPVGAAAPGPAVGGASALGVAAGPRPDKIEARVEQVRSLAVDASVMAGNSAQGTVTLEAPAGYTGTPVSLTSSSPAVSVPQSVRVAGGSSTATFELMAVPGGAPGLVTISAVVAGPGGVARLATIRVWAPQQVQSLQRMAGECPSPIRGPAVYGNVPLAQGDECLVRVRLDSLAGGGARVNLGSSRPDVTVPESAAVGAGLQDAVFPIRVAPNATGGSVTITGVTDRPNGIPKQLTLALADPPAPPAGQVTRLVLASVVEPGLTYGGTVWLDGPAPAGGVPVVFNSSSTAVTLPPTLTVPAGASNATFTARVGPVPPAGDVTISAARSGPGNSVVALILKVRVIQVGDVTFSPDNSGGWTLFLESSNAASVTLDAPSITDVTVNLGSSNAGAVVPASVTIPAGQTRAAFNVSAASGAQPGDATISAVRAGSGGVSKSRALRIRMNQVLTITFNPPEVQWNHKPGDDFHSAQPVSSTGHVSLEAPAGPGGVTVTLSIDTQYWGVSVPASVLVPAGQSSVPFTATVGTDRKNPGGGIGSRTSAPVTAVRSGQPSSEAKTRSLSIVWN